MKIVDWFVDTFVPARSPKKEVVAKPKIRREPGYLYYINSNCDVVRGRQKDRNSPIVGEQELVLKSVIPKREDGCAYYINKEGNICRVKVGRV